MSRDGYLLEVLNILSVLLSTFYLLLWTYLLILKMLTETLIRIPFSVIGRCSLVPASHWLQGKCARINLSLAASGMILQNHRLLPVSIFSVKITAVGSLKRVAGNTFKVSRSQLKLWVWFFHQLRNKKLERKNYACTESTCLLL